MNFSNDLLENINKLHTMELGIIRIRKNLNLDTDDVTVHVQAYRNMGRM